MKTIFRRFNIVDYLALSSGLGLTIAYLVFKNNFDVNSPIMDVWPNIATEILGIWISVRVIDELIQRREKRKGTRTALVEGLLYFQDLMNELQPEFYDWKIQSTLDHFKWFLEKYPKRKKYLFHDEDILAQKAVAIGHDISEIIQSYSKNRNRLLLLKVDFDRTFNEAGQARSNIEENLRKLEDARRKNKEVELPKFTALVANLETNFHEAELTALNEQYSLFLSGKYDEEFYRIPWHENIPSLHRYITNGLRLLEAEFNKFREISDYSSSRVLEAVDSINKSADISTLPPVLQECVSQYSEILKTLANQRLLLERRINDMQVVVKDFATNVYDETNPDD